MSNRTKLARIIAILLAAMMFFAVILMAGDFIFAADDVETEKELTSEEKEKLEKEKEREFLEREREMTIRSYLVDIEKLIEKYKNKEGYYKAVEKLENYLNELDYRNKDLVEDLERLIDNFRKDETDVRNPIFKGDEANQFRPDEYITRAEFSTILMRMLKIQLDWSPVWYENAMKKANELGLIKGDDDGDLMPNKNLTLAEVMAIFQRQKEIVPLDGTSLGISMDHWARGIMERAEVDGWMDRIQRKNEPDRFITRGELAAILTKVRGIKIDKQEIQKAIETYPSYADVFETHTYYWDILVNSR